MKEFSSKTAVITGAGSGLGREFALQLYAAGSRLALCDLDMEGLVETQRLTGDDGSRVSLHRVDVSDRQQVNQFADNAIVIHGAVDMLINNAGITLTPQVFTDIPPAQFDKVMAINFSGVYNGIHAFLPHFLERPEASIVAISSLGGLVGLYGYSPYCASKFAVTGLCESLQSELAGTAVSVLLVHPGGVKTDLMRNAPNLDTDSAREAADSTFRRGALQTPEQVVGKTLKAVRKKKRQIILGLDARAVYAMRRLLPRRFPSLVRMIFSQVMFGSDADQPGAAHG